MPNSILNFLIIALSITGTCYLGSLFLQKVKSQILVKNRTMSERVALEHEFIATCGEREVSDSSLKDKFNSVYAASVDLLPALRVSDFHHAFKLIRSSTEFCELFLAADSPEAASDVFMARLKYAVLLESSKQAEELYEVYPSLKSMSPVGTVSHFFLDKSGGFKNAKSSTINNPESVIGEALEKIFAQPGFVASPKFETQIIHSAALAIPYELRLDMRAACFLPGAADSDTCKKSFQLAIYMLGGSFSGAWSTVTCAREFLVLLGKHRVKEVRELFKELTNSGTISSLFPVSDTELLAQRSAWKGTFFLNTIPGKYKRAIKKQENYSFGWPICTARKVQTLVSEVGFWSAFFKATSSAELVHAIKSFFPLYREVHALHQLAVEWTSDPRLRVASLFDQAPNHLKAFVDIVNSNPRTISENNLYKLYGLHIKSMMSENGKSVAEILKSRLESFLSGTTEEDSELYSR